MFLRRLSVRYVTKESQQIMLCPLHWMDNFAMRRFTNDVIFDDTLPIAEGQMEIGLRVPLDRLQLSMEDWFRRKGYLKVEDRLVVEELGEGL